MKIGITNSSSRIDFTFIPEDGDTPILDRPFNMDRAKCYVELPSGVTQKGIHPDLLGLAVILMVYPFFSSITLPFGVSKQFGETFKKKFQKDIGPIDTQLVPRKSRLHSAPALAFSGGMDSSAALAIMPKTTKSFFLNTPISMRSYYLNQAALAACASIKDRGYFAEVVETDLEFLRNPVGFAVDYSNCVPAVLLADRENLDSIAFGMTQGAAYSISRGAFVDLVDREFHMRWMELFKIVDLPINLVTAGISEVGTMIIAHESGFDSFAQSCVQGVTDHPCNKCWKCFRKRLCEQAVQKTDIDIDELSTFFHAREISEGLKEIPIRQESIFTYATASYDGASPVMQALKRRVRGDSMSIDWMRKWYPHSIELIVPKYRDEIREVIMRYLEEMDERDIEDMKGWDLLKAVETPEYRKNCEQLSCLLEGESPDRRVPEIVCRGARKMKHAARVVSSRLFGYM